MSVIQLAIAIASKANAAEIPVAPRLPSYLLTTWHLALSRPSMNDYSRLSAYDVKIDERAVEQQMTSNTTVRVEHCQLPTAYDLIVATLGSYQSSHWRLRREGSSAIEMLFIADSKC